MKKSPNKLGAALDLLGVGKVVRESRDKVVRTLAKGGAMLLVSHAAGEYTQSEYREAMDYKPEVMVAESSDVGEKLVEGAEKLKEKELDRRARLKEDWWGKMKRKAKERTEKALEWGQKEVVPIEDIRREYREARDNVKEIKKSTLETGDKVSYAGTFGAALTAQITLALLLYLRRRKKEHKDTEESIETLKARKETLKAENETLEAQHELEKMKAKVDALQYQLEEAHRITPAQLQQVTQLDSQSAELLDSLAPELESSGSQGSIS